jgi:iron complex transport system substrate-binding protein
MRRSPTLAGLVLAPLLLTGCGDDPAAPAAEASTPGRIVSLSPTATEMLFAIGAGEQVVAADSYSNYPAEAPTTELDGFEPNAEAILDYEPDLVVASSDPGRLVASLDAVDVPTLILPAATSLDDTYAQIEQLGAETGHVGDAAELVGQMRSEIESLVADIPADGEPVTYFHELDPNLYTVTGGTFLGELYELAGMTSIADEAPDAAGEYPQLSPEYIVSADPDLIFFADGGAGGVTPDEIAGRPGWDQLSAVRHDRVIAVDPDIASRWGPRVVDYLEVLVEARADLGALQPAG